MHVSVPGTAIITTTRRVQLRRRHVDDVRHCVVVIDARQIDDARMAVLMLLSLTVDVVKVKLLSDVTQLLTLLKAVVAFGQIIVRDGRWNCCFGEIGRCCLCFEF